MCRAACQAPGLPLDFYHPRNLTYTFLYSLNYTANNDTPEPPRKGESCGLRQALGRVCLVCTNTTAVHSINIMDHHALVSGKSNARQRRTRTLVEASLTNFSTATVMQSVHSGLDGSCMPGVSPRACTGGRPRAPRGWLLPHATPVLYAAAGAWVRNTKPSTIRLVRARLTNGAFESWP